MGGVRETGKATQKQIGKLMNVTEGRRCEIMDGKFKSSLCPADSRVKVQTVIGATWELTEVQEKIKNY